MPSSRPAIRFQDILDRIQLIRGYLAGMDQAAFDSDRRTRDAVERCLERISEAASKLGTDADRLAPGPPWKAVRSFGNIMRHTYDQVDPARIWEIVTRDLPLLESAATFCAPKPRRLGFTGKGGGLGCGRRCGYPLIRPRESSAARQPLIRTVRMLPARCSVRGTLSVQRRGNRLMR